MPIPAKPHRTDPIASNPSHQIRPPTLIVQISEFSAEPITDLLGAPEQRRQFLNEFESHLAKPLLATPG